VLGAWFLPPNEKSNEIFVADGAAGATPRGAEKQKIYHKRID
jgi:hypothetical protein